MLLDSRLTHSWNQCECVCFGNASAVFFFYVFGAVLVAVWNFTFRYLNGCFLFLLGSCCVSRCFAAQHASLHDTLRNANTHAHRKAQIIWRLVVYLQHLYFLANEMLSIALVLRFELNLWSAGTTFTSPATECAWAERTNWTIAATAGHDKQKLCETTLQSCLIFGMSVQTTSFAENAHWNAWWKWKKRMLSYLAEILCI